MQYKMDMTEIMTNMMDQLMEEEDTSVTVDSVQVSMTITDLNGLESIEVPAEALAS
jgi:hypothetical protein